MIMANMTDVNVAFTLFEAYKPMSEVPRKIAIPISRRAQPPVKAVRTRRSHQKVRTGCITCKIRRKKCDETRPACERCTSTGRKCDGYAAENSSSSSEIATPSTGEDVVELRRATYSTVKGWWNLDADVSTRGAMWPEYFDEDLVMETSDFIVSYDDSHLLNDGFQTQLARRPSASLPRGPDLFAVNFPSSDLESHCFTFFQHCTGSRITAYYDSQAWGRDMVQVALSHPVLYAAVAAVGAVHRRFELGISREAFEYCGHAIRLHAQAKKQIQQLKAESKEFQNMSLSRSTAGIRVPDSDVIMMAEFLLGIFASFQGDWDDAVKHTASGLTYLLNRPRRLKSRGEIHCTVDPEPGVFRDIFEKVCAACEPKFQKPRQRLELAENGMVRDDVPRMFESLAQARDFVCMEMETVMTVPRRVWERKVSLEDARILHVERLLAWSTAYAELSRNNERTRTHIMGCWLLKLLRNLTYFLLYLTLYQDFNHNPPELIGMDLDRLDDEQTQKALDRAEAAMWEAIGRREQARLDISKQVMVLEVFLSDSSLFQYAEMSMGFDTSVNPPPHHDNRPESSRKTRHLVRFPIETDKVKSSTWERLGMYGVAEQMGAVEEHALLQVIQNCLPELGTMWVDVDVLYQERRMIIKYCVPSDDNGGLKWCHEWWEF